MRIPTFARVRKAAINVAGLAAVATSAGLLPGQAAVIVSAVVGLAAAVLHFTVPNAPWGPPASTTGPASHVPEHSA